MDEWQKLLLFRGFFTGRPGLFAKRVLCEDGRHQYRPVWAELTDDLIKAHMRGNVMLGSYPILADNTTHWAAADFDGGNGNAFEHARIFADALREHDIEPLCNVSQSGRGVHVRVIFVDPRRLARDGLGQGEVQRPVHAAIARRFMTKVFERTGLPNYRSGGAFDRVFPSQDVLRERTSIGNQIAMPFNMKAATERGGAMLLDADFNRIQLKDSWDFLSSYRLIRLSDLFDGAEAMGETHYIFECVDADNNFLSGARFDGASRGSMHEQNKSAPRTREQFEFMIRGCDFIQWAKSANNIPYSLWFALVSQLIAYDSVGGRGVFHAISGLDTSCDSRGHPRYTPERADRQYDHALATLRMSYSCSRIAAEGWKCRWLSEDGCMKFERDDGERAFSPAKLPFFNMGVATRRDSGLDRDAA